MVLGSLPVMHVVLVRYAHTGIGRGRTCTGTSSSVNCYACTLCSTLPQTPITASTGPAVSCRLSAPARCRAIANLAFDVNNTQLPVRALSVTRCLYVHLLTRCRFASLRGSTSGRARTSNLAAIIRLLSLLSYAGMCRCLVAAHGFLGHLKMGE